MKSAALDTGDPTTEDQVRPMNDKGKTIVDHESGFLLSPHTLTYGVPEVVNCEPGGSRSAE